MPASSRTADLQRIHHCLLRVNDLVAQQKTPRTPISIASNGDPTTALDRGINDLLFATLPVAGEGWLSEESADSPARLEQSRVWIVDPIDGTRQFVENIPEWAVSVALVENHQAVAGGILNPGTGELFLGSIDTGLEVHSLASHAARPHPDTRPMLVSRREQHNGKWKDLAAAGVDIRAVGSVAYRLALVAAGHAHAACTFCPRSEWDVAAGVALVLASGGVARTLDRSPLRFNQPTPKLPNLFAFAKDCPAHLPAFCGTVIG